MRYFIIYLIFISVITFFVTAYDKIAAKKGSWRVSEKLLFTLAILGGSVSEYFTMRLIRHKTLHKRFMIGLPLIIIIQFILMFILIYFERRFVYSFIASTQ